MKAKKYLLSASILTVIVAFLTALRGDDEVKTWTTAAQPQKEIEALRKLIKQPVFINKDYNVLAYGAKGDGITSNTNAIKNAIEACSKAGGGSVIVPAGKYLTGPIYLKSNVNFHLQDGAHIIFSQKTTDYPIVLTRWEGMDCMNYSPQFYAYNEENIAVTGNGTIDGNADNQHWWSWKGRKEFGWQQGMPDQKIARDSLHALMHAGTDPRKRVFGEGHYLRPYMFAPYNCRNVMVSGVSMINSPMWFISPVMCDNVIIDGVRIKAQGPNTDGCDPDACRNVLIRNCYFDTGDDCIAIKSGRDEDGRKFKRPAENHIIENCEMKDGHGGVVIGSEIAGGAKNIYAVNCRMSSPELNIVLRIKTSSSRGGIIQNVYMGNIQVGTFKESAIACDMFYEKPGSFMPTVRNILVDHLDVKNGGQYAVNIHAYPESPVQNLRILNSTMEGIKTPLKIDHVKDVEFANFRVNGNVVKQP